ncbi:MAG: xanthine dehydrogenase family protein molybdopterin-binding subunit [Geminicoccaceae bacterium]|nr:xanthine dehydrogenase family protein molybdopterin-binding subunit [Geminicoccaceae bacterium]
MAGDGPGLRLEDRRLLTGAGRFTDDTAPAEALRARFLRAERAHAEIRGLDTGAARALPGVLAVLTAADLDADGIGPIPAAVSLADPTGRPIREPPRPAMARDRVRHAGEILALVVAETDALARDALEAIAVDFEPLPAVVEPRAALAPGAARLHESVPGNLAIDWRVGDERAVEAAFARAARIVRLDRRAARIAACYLEPRAVWARHDPASGVTTVTVASQGAHLQKTLLLRALGWDPASLRVVTEDVGGGFGPKLPLYPETVLLAWAARRLGRPVRWAAERAEHFLADGQARELDATLELALDAEGRILALRVDAVAGLGAWLSSFAAIVPTTGLARVISGLYRIPAIAVRLRCAYTTTTPVDAIRGAGKPEALALLETAVDRAAGALGLDPVALRRRNLLRPEDFPWTTPLGYEVEPFDAPALLERALALADRPALPARRREAASRGKRLGFGLACHLHATGALPGECARLELLPDGTVEAWTGTQSQGQGHATVLARIVAEPLGLAAERVRVRQGDTAELAEGPGTGGSSSMVVSGSSLWRGARTLAERVRARSAELLEAAPADVRLVDGVVEVVGTDRRLALAELARRAQAEGAPLRVEQPAVDPVQTWPAGVTTAELELDPETGEVRLLRIVTVLDVGRVIDPKLAEGQVHGAVATGSGEALVERIVFEPATAQLLTGSFLDYALPRARDVPAVIVRFEGRPSTRNPLGVKGLGELPSNGVPAAIANALADALGPGVPALDPPFTPERVWRALRGLPAG